MPPAYAGAVKWLFLTVVVLVAGAVSAFGIYTFGWRAGTNDDDGKKAQVYADSIASQLHTGVESTRHAADSLWRVELSNGDCYVLDIDKFAPLSGGGYAGIIHC